ncbi:MAG TPA: thiamine pyrophosphate-dependent enzyme, partial [Caldisericia bacterium]|nr:thiamine pyrophosphate-dependent enzyme [Caldisericia bacterium]HOL82732.1 thiamine pyrophosphate-dependent enzyme [Caldisericia bacterium]HPP43433.1 thiamine pyrophosphate-dependent enzyme [Caldisericia bacterium]
EEIEEWKKRDPIPRFENELKSRNILDDLKIKAIWDEVRNEIEEAVKFAKESPLAEPEDIFKNIYAGGE